MNDGWIVLRGETHVTLEAAAECYRLEVALVREVYDLGLLGRGEPLGSTVALEAAALDRLAEIVRLHRHHGFDLEAVEVLLEELLRAR